MNSEVMCRECLKPQLLRVLLEIVAYVFGAELGKFHNKAVITPPITPFQIVSDVDTLGNYTDRCLNGIDRSFLTR